MARSAAHVVETRIKVDGRPLPDSLSRELADLRVEQTIDLPDQATLRFFDPDLELANGNELSIGRELDIEVTNAGGTVGSILMGEITSLVVEQTPSGIFELVVTAHDRAHRLARNVRVRTYAAMTDSDIVGQIGAEYGLRVQADTTRLDHDYLLQNESDYAFLTRRALALGYRWWVDDRKLFFKQLAEPGAGAVIDRDELLSLRIRMSGAETAQTVTVRGWDSKTQQAVVGSAKPKPRTSAGFPTDAAAPTTVPERSDGFGEAGRFATGSLADPASADALAGSIGNRIISGQVSMRGTVDGDPEVRPGTAFELQGIGQQLSGVYAVTTAEHVIGAERGYLTKFRCEGVGSSELVDLVRPPDTRPRLEGLMVGIVTNVVDHELPARVKVHLPTMTEEDESAWARLVMPGAGSGRGWQILPEVQDEVLVGFEQGDPAHPVVLGGLWSGANPPPLSNDESISSDQVVKRVFHTRTGHRLEFAETDGDGEIVLALADEKAVVTMSAEGITVKTSGDVAVEAEGGIGVKATGDLRLDGRNVTIKAENKVDIQGTEVGAKGSAKTAIQGATTEVKADATLSLSGSAVAELKGGMVKLN